MGYNARISIDPGKRYLVECGRKLYTMTMGHTYSAHISKRALGKRNEKTHLGEIVTIISADVYMVEVEMGAKSAY